MSKLLKPKQDTGIVGYGAYIPAYRLATKEISELWRGGQDAATLSVEEKSVPGPDEDTITMAIEAARNALLRAEIDPADIRSVWVGSESHPYAVKPSGTVVAQALGIAPAVNAADLEFACKGGTEALQASLGFVGSGMADYAMAIAMDTAQGRPGDFLEYTAAAGGAAYILGPATESLAVLEASFSYVSDTPDFFRRAYQKFPEHGNRFTGGPAFFNHILSSTRFLMEELGLTASDFAAAVFHQPNAKFPRRAADMLGFTPEQIETGLLAPHIGNSYAGASPLGFSAVLDKARPGDRLLLASFGSGAGSDAFSFIVTDKINEVRDRATRTATYLKRRKLINYATYTKWRNKIKQY